MARIVARPGRPALAARAQFRHWINDFDLRCSRDAAWLARLPVAERAEWEAFWVAVRSGAK